MLKISCISTPALLHACSVSRFFFCCRCMTSTTGRNGAPVSLNPHYAYGDHNSLHAAAAAHNVTAAHKYES